MNELVRCKSCGFIMTKGKLKDKCPACGVSAKMFEDYIERISPKRKMILSLDIHPVMAHFPQAYTPTILILSLLALVVPGALKAKIIDAIAVLGFALPFVVLLTFCAGLLDGKIRFRKVTTALLRRKMALGSAFFLLSCAIFAVILTEQLASVYVLIVIGALSLPALGCASALGLLGVSIQNSKFPG